MNLPLTRGIALTSAVAVVLSGCGNDGTDKNGASPLSPTGSLYVDSHRPAYTDTFGTTYEGDYYPVAAGYRWDYAGPVSVTTTYSVTGTLEGQQVNEQDRETDSGIGRGFRVIRPRRRIRLPSGEYTVYPEQFMSSFWDPYSYDETVRYLEKLGDAVYVRAFEGTDGQLVEVRDPVFIKSPLVVGDRWVSSPKVEYNAPFPSMEDSDGIRSISFDMNSVIHVVGTQNVTVMGRSVEAVRLEQVMETGGLIATQYGDMSINMTMIAVFYLKKNLGIVTQKLEDMSMNMQIMLSEGAVRLTMDMTVTGATELSLTGYPASFQPLTKPGLPRPPDPRMALQIRRAQQTMLAMTHAIMP